MYPVLHPMPYPDLQPIVKSLVPALSGSEARRQDRGWRDAHARIACLARVLARRSWEKDGMVAALAGATMEAPGVQVSVGIAARPVRPRDRSYPPCEVEAAAASRIP